MIAYPAISPLSADRHALDLVIGLTGLVDRHRPESLIVFTGMRKLFYIHYSMSPNHQRYVHTGQIYGQ